MGRPTKIVTEEKLLRIKEMYITHHNEDIAKELEIPYTSVIYGIRKLRKEKRLTEYKGTGFVSELKAEIPNSGYFKWDMLGETAIV